MEAIKLVFLLGVSNWQVGSTPASLLDEAVSAGTVSNVCKIFDRARHHREMAGPYEYLLANDVSLRSLLVMQSNACLFALMALCSSRRWKRTRKRLLLRVAAPVFISQMELHFALENF